MENFTSFNELLKGVDAYNDNRLEDLDELYYSNSIINYEELNTEEARSWGY